ncbi:MAG: FRG domain-containing protein [Eubacteriales bacterium]|nr:FRG domain-containing protein [Eubacteriales bacterium]
MPLASLAMVTSVKLNSLEDVMALLEEQELNENINRFRSPYYYIGLPNADFRLQTSIVRNCKHLAKTLEPSLLRSFTKYAVIDDPDIADSVWRQMIVGRHHGLPTRLLDCTHSPLISLHFATSGEGLEVLGTHDFVIWRLDIKEIHSLLPPHYRKPLEREKADIYTVDMLKEVVNDLDEYDDEMGDRAMVIVEPPSLDQRIISQFGNFLVVPLYMKSIETFLNQYTENTVRYVVDKSLAWRIRDMLDQLNISERTVYPGLDGLSAWLARHYYVK